MHRRPQFEPLARLAAAGCGLFGPWGPRWVGLSCRTRLPGPFVLRWCICFNRAVLRRLCRRCAFGLAAPLGLGWVLGLCFALARLTCRVLLRRLCRRCAFGWLRRWGLGWVLGLRLAWVRLPCWVLLRRLCRRGAFGWLCPWVWAGCLGL